MSQDTKGRTLIGTPPPSSHPRPGTFQQPARPAASSAPSSAPADWPTTIGPASPVVPPGAAMSAGEADPLIGQELCGYTIRRKLAEGGMGVVYEGVHGKIGRLGAIKILRPELCRSEQVVERFYQEARAVNAIRHENIVDVHDFGRDPYGRVFFVMEYLEGEPLSARIRRGALGWPEAFPILDQTLRALKAAHDKGFVHRDLKPDNIWLKYIEGRVQVKLLDFGIAKLVGSDAPAEALTQAGSVIGTPHYMSPEQINGARDIDHRTDIYALGVIMYEMFAGVTPFVGDTLQAIMTGHLFRDPPRLADIPTNLGVPAPIAEIVDRMLVKDPAGRYQSVIDVLADLHDVNNQRWPAIAATLGQLRPTRVLPPGATPAPPPSARPADSPRSRSKAPWWIVGGLVAAAIAVAIVVSMRSQPTAPGASVPAGPAAVPAGTAPATGAAVAQPASSTPSAPVEPALDDDKLRGEAQSTLRAALRETEPAVRVQGSDALGRIKDQPSVPALTTLTQSDPDGEVRGHAADSLGVIGASSAAELLARLETAAPPPLKVWYASALARLGDKAAVRRLLAYARSKDLAVSFKAGLTLAEVSPPGDRPALAALKALAAHEAELGDVAPYAGALILTRMAALRDAGARKVLYGILEHSEEGARIAAAEGLAKLGDDAGKKVLRDVLANQKSPNRLVAAVAQIPLGEYGGLDVITASLDARDPGTRRLAARALGDVGERESLPALIALAHDKDWTVRIAAAAAIVGIVGLSSQVLAQASVDWTKGALASQDWAVREAAAGVLADIPEKQAVPLLAQAILDRDPKVRLAASRSAGRMKSADAAEKVALAVKAETDAGVKEQQVKALGEIGNPVARDTLAQIAGEPGRIGVIAAGALIAVGDETAKQKLDSAILARDLTLRLAAMHAATSAKNPIVVPTLKIGLGDLVFDVRFAAAEGLSMFRAEKDSVLPVLAVGLRSRDADVVARAFAALTRFGEKVKGALQSPAEMIESTDPQRRLAAVQIVRALPPGEGVPLLRRLIADPDLEVRRAAADAIADLVSRDKDQAIKLYKLLVNDPDPVVRSKASGQLSQLVAPPKTASAPPPAPTPAAAAVDDKLPGVKRALDDATAAAAEVKAASEAFEAIAGELATATAAPARDDAATDRVAALARSLEDAAARLDGAAARVEAAAKAAELAGAGASPDAAKLVEDARALAVGARSTASAARGKANDAADKARKYVKAETSDAQILIAAADAAIAAGNVADARQSLDRAARLLQRSGTRNASLLYSYAQLYDHMALRTKDAAARLKLLQQAAEAYRRFASSGAGSRVRRANDRLAEIAEEIKELQH